jgi:hypothetical protein
MLRVCSFLLYPPSSPKSVLPFFYDSAFFFIVYYVIYLRIDELTVKRLLGIGHSDQDALVVELVFSHWSCEGTKWAHPLLLSIITSHVSGAMRV